MRNEQYFSGYIKSRSLIISAQTIKLKIKYSIRIHLFDYWQIFKLFSPIGLQQVADSVQCLFYLCTLAGSDPQMTVNMLVPLCRIERVGLSQTKCCDYMLWDLKVKKSLSILISKHLLSRIFIMRSTSLELLRPIMQSKLRNVAISSWRGGGLKISRLWSGYQHELYIYGSYYTTTEQYH